MKVVLAISISALFLLSGCGQQALERVHLAAASNDKEADVLLKLASQSELSDPVGDWELEALVEVKKNDPLDSFPVGHKWKLTVSDTSTAISDRYGHPMYFLVSKIDKRFLRGDLMGMSIQPNKWTDAKGVKRSTIAWAVDRNGFAGDQYGKILRVDKGAFYIGIDNEQKEFFVMRKVQPVAPAPVTP